MKIDEVLNQFRVINVEIKYLKKNFTGIDIDFGIKGYNEFLQYDLCNLTVQDVYKSKKKINDLFDQYKEFSAIIKKYPEDSEYFLDELFTELQEQNFILTGISIDKWREEYLYDDLIQRQGEPEFLKTLENFHHHRVSCLRELRLKIEQQEQFIANNKSNHIPKKELTFNELFRNPEHPYLVKKILEDNYYTKDGKWTYNGKKNTLATAFYVLSDPEPTGEIQAIIPDKVTAQIKAFYKEFDLIIAENSGNGVYSTIRNVMKRPQFEINEKKDYKKFNELFQQLKDSETKK